MVELPYNDLLVKFDKDIYQALIPVTGWTVKQGTARYFSVRATKKPYVGQRLSRLILCCPQNLLVDHINGDPLDNRVSNLRIASHSQNQFNKRVSSSKKSGLPKGVYYNSRLNKFWAELKFEKQRVYLGLFKTSEEAEQEYIRASIKYHQQYARIG